jgi:hypothetical protein
VRGRRLERALPPGPWRRFVVAGGEVFDAEALGGA